MFRIFHSCGLILLAFLAGCSDFSPPEERDLVVHDTEFSAEELKEILSLSPIPKAPENPTNQYADSPAAAELGQQLFFETRLSKNGEVSCATCHQPEQDWTDGRSLSKGLVEVSRNAPTLFNLAHSRWQFWDGRKDTLWSQSLGPIENEKEMGGSRTQAYLLIAESPELAQAYRKVFGDIPKLSTTDPPRSAQPLPNTPDHPMNQAWEQLSSRDQDLINRVFTNLGKAIEAYERKLVSENSRFDQFVAALNSAPGTAEEILSASEVRGLQLFVGKGQCTFCHSGPLFTDLEFHNIGLDRGDGELDTGRFAGVEQVKTDPFNGLGPYSDDTSLEANKSLFYLAQKPNNLGEFKTPTLRNISNTAPYMHDGRFATLAEVVEFYSLLHQQPALGHREETLQPLKLSETDLQDLVAFLGTLEGAPLPAALKTAPQ